MSADDDVDRAGEDVAGQGEGRAPGEGTGSDAESTDARKVAGGEPSPRTSTDRPPARRRTLGSDLASVGRFFWTHNPLYVVSAFLTLYGLRMAFAEAEKNSWPLLGVLVGYTGLMAAAACVVTRWGKVWDDARSILLMVVLLILALSASFDEIGIRDPRLGIGLLLTGLACAVLLSEGLLRGIGIRLRAWYRIAYYAVLGVFFGCPIVPMALTWHDPILAEKSAWWELLSFPVAGAAALLLLLPAARRGRAYARRNGTPWKWPWFPWTLFGLLGAGLCVRSYFLSLSLYWVKGLDTPFGPYFLLPLIFAGGLILLEGGLRRANRRAQVAALLFPVLAVVLSFPGSGGSRVYQHFLREIVLARFGSPVPIALGAAVAFYIYAALRRVRGAEWGLVAAFTAWAFIDGKTLGLSTLTAPRPLLLLLVGAVELVQGIRRRSSPRLAVALGVLTAAGYVALPEAWSEALRLALTAHALALGAMAIGLLCSDRFVRRLLSLAAFALAALQFAAIAFHWRIFPDVPTWAVLTYGAAMAALPWGYWRLTRNTSFLTAAVANTCWLTGGLAVRGWKGTRRFLEFRGSYPIVFGALSFLAALAISLTKGRAIARLRSARGSDATQGRGV